MSQSGPILRCARAAVVLLVLVSGTSLADRQIRTERVSFERGPPQRDGRLPARDDRRWRWRYDPAGDRHSCAGVKRQGQGAAIVTITRPDGRSRTIFFETGRVTGYDQSEADSGKLSVSRQGDLNIIQIGPECYEIPDALPFGG